MSPLVAQATPRTPVIGGAASEAPPLLPPASPRTPRPAITLTAPPSNKRRRRGGAARSSLRAIRAVRALFRSLPILAPACRFPGVVPRHGGGGGGAPRGHDGHISGASRTTGTLFGHRRARVTLAVQETPGSVPILLLELAMQTGRFMQEMGAEHLRVALECEKRPPGAGAGIGRTRLLDESLWTAYVNGRKIGYAVRREPTDDDLTVMQLLRTVSAGAGVLPADVVGAGAAAEGQEAGDLAYMRAHFDRVVGSRDSESFYMLNPDGNNGPELSIFFIRI
ncbi:Protein MIZU-KUSSEI 1 [Dichanthelium oligosanthes]|uniref:Protein MIZU-KUSSEI 1 n=1 Tax=Dichanthelium oligosanthes TaxID=888268 RepID=A0A1E5UJ99_9POAL|nr:Protein MIZU-KUSSEI 1 [Dichanthelium oligosanthes]